jgi:integrase/recombinase XerD
MDEKNLGVLVSIYAQFLKAENQSPRSTEAVNAAVTRFGEYLDTTDITTVAANDLREYIRHLQTRPKWESHPTITSNGELLSPHSIASFVRSIKTFWSWLAREEFIVTNPLKDVSLPKIPQQTVKTLSPEQFQKIIKVIDKRSARGYHDYAWLMLLYATGMRIDELASLRIPDVNWDNGQLHVLGKGCRERNLWLSPKAYKVALTYYRKWRPEVSSDYFFVQESGRKLTRHFAAHRMYHYRDKAGIAGIRFHPHLLRHAFSLEFLRAGNDPYTLQKVLGHSTLTMTLHYARLADRDVEIKMKKFSPIEYLDI